MKNLLVVMSLIASTLSFGSSLVCSNERLYSSNVRGDFGTKPPTGTVTGTNVILYNQEVILKYDMIAGLHVAGRPPFSVREIGEEKVLETTGNMTFGSKTYKVKVALEKYDPKTGELIEEVAQEDVVCRRTWAMVP